MCSKTIRLCFSLFVVNLAFLFGSSDLYAQTSGLTIFDTGDIQNIVGVFVDARTSYVSNTNGVWTIDDSNSSFTAIEDPMLGTPLRVSVASRSSNQEGIFVAAFFNEPGIGLSSSVFKLAEPEKRVAHWSDSAIREVDGALTGYGSFSGIAPARCQVGEDCEFLPLDTIFFNGGAATDVTDTGYAGGTTLEIATGFTQRAVIWFKDDFTILAPEQTGSITSIRDRQSSGRNLGAVLDGQANVAFGKRGFLKLTDENGAPILVGSVDSVFVTNSDLAVVNTSLGPLIYFDGVSTPEGQAVPIHEAFPGYGLERFSNAGRPASSRGMIFIPLQSDSEAALFVAEDPTIRLGDVNCDGELNLLDVAPIVEFLTSGVYQVRRTLTKTALLTCWMWPRLWIY